MIEKKKIVFLTTFLHTGLDWIHSLFDGHNEILILPPISFYRCWIKLNLENESKKSKVYEKFYKYINENIGPDCQNQQNFFNY